MTADEMLLNIRATIDGFYPWKAFVGLVMLRSSELAPLDHIYACDPRLSGMVLYGVDQFVIIHPDLLPVARQAMAESEGVQNPTDPQLAAWLFWAIRTVKP